MDTVMTEFYRLFTKWEHETENLTLFADMTSLHSFGCMRRLGLTVLPIALEFSEGIDRAKLIVWALLEEVEKMLISGEHSFTDEELRFYFELLVEKWCWEASPISDPKSMVQLASYRAIVAMGDVTVPWILEKISRNSYVVWLITALSEITGECPIPKEYAGRVSLMVEDWLNWAKENNIDYKKKDSRITPESWQQMLAQLRAAAEPGLAEELKHRQLGKRANRGY